MSSTPYFIIPATALLGFRAGKSVGEYVLIKRIEKKKYEKEKAKLIAELEEIIENLDKWKGKQGF